MFKLSKSHNLNLLKVYKEAHKIYDEGLILRKRKRRKKIFRTLRIISFFIISLFICLALILSIHFVNFRLIQKEAALGKENLEKAVDLLSQHQNQGAIYYAKVGQDKFGTSLDYLQTYKNNFLAKNFSFFQNQFNDLTFLLNTGQILSRGTEEAAKFSFDLDLILGGETNFSKLSLEKKEALFRKIYEGSPELNGLKASVDLAVANFQRINYIGLLRPFKGEIVDMGQRLEATQFLLNQTVSLSQVLPVLFGYPDPANYLVLFLDNSRIEPVGGTIKAYGILRNSQGEILDFKTSTIGNLLTEKQIDDLNLSPDWLVNAEKLKTNHKKVFPSALSLDGVIAIEPEFLVNLLSLSGPIVISGQTYTASNVISIFKTQNDFAVLGDLLANIKTKLFDNNVTNLYNTLNVLGLDLAKKNVLINFTDKNLQAIAEEKGWAGEVKNLNGDYLLVTDANLNPDSQDYFIGRSLEYSVDQDVNGLFSDLHVNYVSNYPVNTDITDHKIKVKIYVPKGSKLILVKGFETAKVETLTENNKTVFAGELSISPGRISRLRVYYKLPAQVEKLNTQGAYSLYVQKQPGRKTDLLIVDFKSQNDIRLYNPTGFSADKEGSQQIHWETDLLTDKFFQVYF